MRVVLSDSCPMLSLITESGICWFNAMLAQLWRALYNADVSEKINAKKIIDNNEYQ